jgi:hypothetical protein
MAARSDGHGLEAARFPIAFKVVSLTRLSAFHRRHPTVYIAVSDRLAADASRDMRVKDD